MKKLYLVLVLLLLPLASAQSLEDFSYQPGKGYSTSFTGGESFVQNVSFHVESEREVPLALELRVKSQSYDMSSSGAEFSLKGEWRTDSGLSDEFNFTYRAVNGTGLYRAESVGSSGFIPPGTRNTISITVDSSRRIIPDKYSFELRVKSSPGFTAETKSFEVSEGFNSFEIGSSGVLFEASASGNVNVSTYSDMAVAGPESAEMFVNGLEVDVEGLVLDDRSVRIGYTQGEISGNFLEEDSIRIYRLNKSSGKWTTEGVEMVYQDFRDNYVVAEVDHFSTYAAFAEEYREVPGVEGGDFEAVNEPEQDTGDGQQGSGSEGEQVTPPGGSEDSGSDGQVGLPGIFEGIPFGQSGLAAPQSPVGEFFTSNTSRIGLILVLLVLIAGLVWRFEWDFSGFRSRLNSFRGD
ncbi:MAG: hypothetical protein ABEK10_01275 [Candidatus Nanosalina sp.]